jgi:hypothetical protein
MYHLESVDFAFLLRKWAANTQTATRRKTRILGRTPRSGT